MKDIIQYFLNKGYRIARALFWSLPAPLRAHLHGVRHGLVRRLRGRIILTSSRDANTSDIGWDKFFEKVLSMRDSFERVIVFEPTVDWGIVLFQRPQHMAMALGRRGCLVIYRTTGDNLIGFREVAPNVWLANAPEVDMLQDVDWCFYSTALLCSPQQVAARRKCGKIIFEYIDHIHSAISGGKKEVEHLLALKDAMLSGAADYIVVSAKSLYNEVASSKTNVPIAYIPNGVDSTHFCSERHLSVVLPQHLMSFRKHYKYVVGYFGAIAPWLWYDLIESLSEKMGDVGFIFIGPDYSGCTDKLPRTENVIYLGAVNYEVLPAYARCFDVAFIPFEPGDIARSTSPLKLFEYFALGKPVVVTSSMDECVAFPEVFSGFDVTTFMEALEKAFLVSRDIDYCGKLRYLALENSWDVRAEVYLAFLREGKRQMDSHN